MGDNTKYEGFATPSLILVNSDKGSSGSIIDPYSRTDEQDGLICGYWSKGIDDCLIHIYLVKPVAALCDERQEWVAKQTLLKEPIISTVIIDEQSITNQTKHKPNNLPKRNMILDSETGQFRMM